MELAEYIRLFRKWLWLLIVAALLFGGVSFLIRSRQANSYEAQVMLSVGGFIQSPNPDSTEIRTGVELAQTYAVLARTYDVLEAAIDAGDFPLTVQELERAISTRVIPNTSLLVVTVNYADPIMAADIANEVARQLIQNSPSNLTAEQQAQLAMANEEIARLNTQLRDQRAQLQLIDSQLGVITDTNQQEQLRAQRNLLVNQINQASANLAQFSDTIANLQSRTNSLSVVEQARIPTEPSGTSVFAATLLGMIIGVVLAAGAVLLIEYLDDTVGSSEETAQMLKLPVLGMIPRFGKSGEDPRKRLITFDDPSSPISESYRVLRTNLLFSVQGEGTQAYIVTSPGPEEGKSVTAANLAVAMAATGMRVLLVDADLRRPMIHRVLGLQNELGLTTLLSAAPAEEIDIGQFEVSAARECLQDTSVPRLRAITSGFLPANPAEVLGTTLMKRWFNAFRKASNVDVIIFDTPPVLVVSDAAVLAAATGASVVLVVNAGRTRRNAAIKAREQFTQLGVEVKGVVLNQISSRTMRDDYGYGGRYYYYYSSDSSRSGRQNGKPASKSAEQNRDDRHESVT